MQVIDTKLEKKNASPLFTLLLIFFPLPTLFLSSDQKYIVRFINSNDSQNREYMLESIIDAIILYLEI